MVLLDRFSWGSQVLMRICRSNLDPGRSGLFGVAAFSGEAPGGHHHPRSRRYREPRCRGDRGEAGKHRRRSAGPSLRGPQAEFRGEVEPRRRVHASGSRPCQIGWAPPLLNRRAIPAIQKGGEGFIDVFRRYCEILDAAAVARSSRTEGDIHIYGNPITRMDPRTANHRRTSLPTFARLRPQARGSSRRAGTSF